MDKTVEINIMRSDGETFAIDGALFKLLSDGLIGIDTVASDVYRSSNYNGDGTVFTGQKLLPKEITIKANLINSSNLLTAREQATKFFNPTYTFYVYITYLGKVRLVIGKIIGFRMPSGNVNKSITLQVTFLSESPFLFSQNMTTIIVTESTDKFQFPYVSDEENGFVFSETTPGSKIIENDGDFETGVLLNVNCSGGASNIDINLNGKHLKYIGTLSANDELNIDLDSKPISVTKNGVNDIKNIDKTSDLYDFKLKLGGNLISYEALSGVNNVQVIVSYYKKYNGM